jgi:osmoprotectant transport system substrate-binding protein
MKKTLLTLGLTLGIFALLSLNGAQAQSVFNPLGGGTPKATGAARNSTVIVIGSADFPESELLATIYAKALAARGYEVSTTLNIGSREVTMPALLDGSIDLIPEYTGAMLNYLDPKATAHTPDDVTAALGKILPSGIAMLTPSNAQDSDVLAVTRATAAKYRLRTIADLVPVAGQMVLGGPPEWETRQEGVVGLRNSYGIHFQSFRPLDAAGPITLSALLNGQVQAADMTSADPAMALDRLVALADTRNVFPAQNIVPIIATKKIAPKVTATLNAVSAALTTADLVTMNQHLRNFESFDAVAADWLNAHKLN